MSNALTVINETFRKKENVNQFALALGFRTDDENGKQEAFRYIASVLAEIQRSASDEKKDLTVCAPQSLVQCAIDAARLKLTIDARQHAHLVKYNNKGRMEAQLQVGFRGYVSKITEHYPDTDISAELVWQGDELTIRSEDGFDHYNLVRKNPFQDQGDQLAGVMVVMAFTKGDRKFQHVTTVSKNDISKIRKKAKFDTVWSEWFTEKAKVAAVKRASKFVFAGLTGLQELIRYDNAHNFQPLKAPDAPKAGSIVENINAGTKELEHQPAEPAPGMPPVETREPEIIMPETTAAYTGATDAAVQVWPDELVKLGHANASDWSQWMVETMDMNQTRALLENFAAVHKQSLETVAAAGFTEAVEVVRQAFKEKQGRVKK